jgi:hypothetical protein
VPSESELKLCHHAKTKLFLIRSGTPPLLGCSLAERKLFIHPFAESRERRAESRDQVLTVPRPCSCGNHSPPCPQHDRRKPAEPRIRTLML